MPTKTADEPAFPVTPIQKAIKFWTERYKEAKEAGSVKLMEAADLFLQYLQAIVSEEKKFVSDVWEAAIAHENDTSDFPMGDVTKTEFPNKQQYLKQLYP